MPPRKTPAKSKAALKSTPGANSSARPQARRSRLAKENDITAEEEARIKEAWSLFSIDEVEEYEDEKEGVIRTSDVQKVLKAQGLAPSSQSQMEEFIETLDPESEGYVTYPHFLALCAIQLKSKTDETKAEEVETAFNLFHPGQVAGGKAQVIRLEDLRAVAKTLNEDDDVEVLKAMILEANGGKGVNRGVNIDEFQSIMTRAGVFH
ncbi:calmodulin [Fonsecaea erecta]|uniref:Calmodulin n=1 Tax=Fonsecaea erecta TaxID=1367422 RepID=A0A178ZT26_9EURO|nr:calmodulin [Fonsecaea erecta]OAP62576.1 calmodulin [Fonsecaea erecta]